MNTLRSYLPFLASALLMWLVLWIVYPHYQYYVDPDGTAYLTISQRYANGDYFKAINGYWSPWSCWLTALLIKVGLQAIPASVVVNAVGAMGYLGISQSFFLRFSFERSFQWMLNVALSLFLVFAIFWQSFDDLWECFFLLAVLRMMLSEGYAKKPAMWVAAGMVGGLAYFAKSYSFPFFLLNMAVCGFFISGKNFMQWFKMCAVSVAVMVVVGAPWMYLLHEKYGIWTTSTAGQLNTSWYLVGHPHWKYGIKLLLPPAYPDSPYYWEDPWLANGETPHFWSSWHLFGLQFVRIALNLLKLLRSSFELSVFFPVVGVIAVLSLKHRKWKPVFSEDARIIVYSFLLFPLGYVLVNFESRYLWYMLPLAIVIGNVLRQQFLTGRKWIPAAAALSLLVFPVWGMRKMHNVGEAEFRMAQELKQMGISGTFTSNATPGLESQWVERIAYFSGMHYYTIPKPTNDNKVLLEELRRYSVDYFFSLDSDSQEKAEFNLVDESGKPFSSVMVPFAGNKKEGEWRVFVVNP